MMTSIKKILFVVGVVILSFGVGFKSFFVDSPSLELLPYSGSISVNNVIGAPGPEDRGSIKAELEINVDQLYSVKSDQGFIIKVKVIIKQVNFVPKFLQRHRLGFEGDIQNHDIGMPTAPTMSNLQFSDEELREFVLKRFRNGEIAFSLHLAGAKWEPKGKTPISSSGIAQWSVKPESSGTIEGFLKPEFLKSYGGHNAEHRIEFQAEEYIPVKIKSSERIVTKRGVLSAIFSFFGGLLTLPGILVFTEGRRKKRNKRKLEEEKAKPNISSDISSFNSKK